MLSTFFALSDPTRRRIIELVARGPLSAGELSIQFDMTAAAISQHLAVLLESRIVAVTKTGAKRYYELRSDGLQELESWMMNVAAARSAHAGAGSEDESSTSGPDWGAS